MVINNKKILYIFPTTLGSACLDTNISSVAQDSLALSEIFENNGYEVWMYNPYKRKKSSWPRQVLLEEIPNWEGDIIFAAQQGHLRQLNGQSIRPIQWDDRFRKILQYTYKHHLMGTKIFIPIFDVKTSFFTPPITSDFYDFNKINPERGDSNLYDKYFHICNKASLIFPDKKSALIFLKELKLYNRNIYEMNIFDHTHKYLNFPKELPDERLLYDFIYTGFALTNYRKSRLEYFFNNLNLKLGQGGPLKVPKKLNFESLTNHKQINHKENLNLLNLSNFQLIFGEPNNTFLTPRLFMSLLGNSITFIDCSYKSAASWAEENNLYDRIVRNKQELLDKYHKLKKEKEKNSSFEKEIAKKWLSKRKYIFNKLNL